MASSNKHWPSMFKSKSCSTTHHQWQHGINSSLMSSGCNKPPHSSVEERTPEPKPRWNPRPEQIRILESIFNSGMVNPPRDEIRRIRARLQEYGQVGDANVFYWFQNRKSRSKNKHRQLSNTKSQPQKGKSPPITSTTAKFAPSPSSSSSDKSSPNPKEKPLSLGFTSAIDVSYSPTTSLNKISVQTQSEFLTEPFFFPVQQQPSLGSPAALTQGFCFPDVCSMPGVVAGHNAANSSSVLLGDLLLMNHGSLDKNEADKMKLDQQLDYAVTTALNTAPTTMPRTFYLPSSTSLTGGLNEPDVVGPTKSTVFINDVCFEVAMGPFNVREAFGEDAVLMHSSGQPILTNEYGVTLYPLQHGAFYYLVRAFTSSPDHKTIDLI